MGRSHHLASGQPEWLPAYARHSLDGKRNCACGSRPEAVCPTASLQPRQELRCWHPHRSLVHGWFRNETRIPEMRTETAQGGQDGLDMVRSAYHAAGLMSSSMTAVQERLCTAQLAHV